jgi:hypothetical protein
MIVTNSNIIVDGKSLKLNRFITELTGNIIEGIAKSLKFTDGKQIQFRLQGEELSMQVDGKEVPLNIGHAGQMVRDVLAGLLKNLYGAENAREVVFVCERS